MGWGERIQASSDLTDLERDVLVEALRQFASIPLSGPKNAARETTARRISVARDLALRFA